MNNEENNELIDQNTVQETPLTDNVVNEQPSTISEPVMEEVNTQPNEPLTNENIKIDILNGFTNEGYTCFLDV